MLWIVGKFNSFSLRCKTCMNCEQISVVLFSFWLDIINIVMCTSEKYNGNGCLESQNFSMMRFVEYIFCYRLNYLPKTFSCNRICCWIFNWRRKKQCLEWDVEKNSWHLFFAYGSWYWEFPLKKVLELVMQYENYRKRFPIWFANHAKSNLQNKHYFTSCFI